jgi:hypothetical protein
MKRLMTICAFVLTAASMVIKLTILMTELIISNVEFRI